MNRPAAGPAGPLEDELRAAFAAATSDLPPTRDPWARTTRAVARSRARRRAGALAALAVASVIVLVAVVHTPARPVPPPPAGPQVTDPDVRTWPTRGSLAGDAALLARVRAVAPGADKGTVLSVPFLGAVDGRDVALAIVPALDDQGRSRLKLVTLSGSPSRPVDQWERSDGLLPSGEESDPVVPLLSAGLAGDDGRSRLVVLTLTGRVSVAYSERPAVDDQGAVSRRYREIPLRDGVGTVSWSGRLGPVRTRLQQRAQAPVVARPQVVAPGSVSTEEVGGSTDVAASCQARGESFENLRLNLVNVARDVLQDAGRSPGQVALLQALACHRVGRETYMIAGVELDDGTAFRSVVEYRELDGGAGLSYPVQVPVPRGRAGTYPLYLPLSSTDDAPDQVRPRSALVLAPGGASVDVVQRTGVLVATAKLSREGLGVVTVRSTYAGLMPPANLDLVVRDATGRETERVPAAVHRGPALDEDVDGPVEGP
ncbi:MAG TPA: hypothetical protein VE781_05435 [Kineosporiaceae bacterium]|jgi:hypothetical protein|nr:hypothetical protein [Kineosporiaceae bacterium]